MEDHDQRFKVLLKEFLPEFFELFLPDWAKRLDFSRVEWLPQEAFHDPPRGAKVEMDLAAKVATREPTAGLRHGEAESCLAVIHIEIESPDRVVSFRHRMFDYYVELRRQYNIPVLPIALFLNVGLNGLGWDAYEEVLWGRSVLRFEYAYIGLPALDATQYANGPNVLGAALAALMKVPKDGRAERKAQSLLSPPWQTESEWRRFLLAECFDTYYPLNDAERIDYQRLLTSESELEMKTMNTMAIHEGRELKAREILHKQLAKRFAPLSEAVEERIKKLPMHRVDQLLVEIFDANSLKDLGLED